MTTQGDAGEAPIISVVIPHLNQPEFLARCLESLLAGRRKPDEIIVVDNGSAVPPQDICDAVPGVKLLVEPTPGPGPARNLGIGASRGDILAFIDADCIADPGWLAAAEVEMADPEAMILGGDVRIWLSDPARLTALEAYESIYAYRMDRYIKKEGFTGTGNLVVRRVVFGKVGLFAGLSVAEDIDWGKRATAMGYRIRFAPSMRVYHPARQNIGELLTKWDRHTAHFFVSATARKGGHAIWAAKALAMAVSPVAELPRIMTSPRLSGWRSRGLAISCLTRVRLHRARSMAKLLAGVDPGRLSGAWNRAASPSKTPHLDETGTERHPSRRADT